MPRKLEPTTILARHLAEKYAKGDADAEEYIRGLIDTYRSEQLDLYVKQAASQRRTIKDLRKDLQDLYDQDDVAWEEAIGED